MYEINDAEVRAAERALKSRRYFRYGGKEVPAFEKEWAEKIGVDAVVAVTSGTAALSISLAALGIGPGDEVVVPAYTFVATALAVTAVGAIPIIADIDDSLTLCPDDLERLCGPRTKCVIPVHMQGMPCNMNRILSIARDRGLLILEDCCQAAGGSYGGRKLGSLGNMGAFSFNQFKIISCGEGGAAVTSDSQLAERAFMAQDGSCSVWPETGVMSQAFFCAGNFRFNDVNAAILRAQVRKLDSILSRLRRARSYIVSQLDGFEGFRLIPSHDEKGNCGVCFLVQASDESKAIELERCFGGILEVHRPIDSGRHVYSAWRVLHERLGGHHPGWDCFTHPANQECRQDYSRALPAADSLFRRTVLCKTPYGLKKNELDRLVDKLKKRLSTAAGKAARQGKSH